MTAAKTLPTSVEEFLVFAQLVSCEIFGIEGRVLDVQVDFQGKTSGFILSGLPGKGVRDSRERIRSAIQNSGFRFPEERIVVNLAPAALEKGTSVLDLPIALGVLLAKGELPIPTDEFGVLGELSLDGTVQPVTGTLGLVSALAARGTERVLVPVESLSEALVVPGIRSIGVRSLRHAARVLTGEDPGVTEPLQPRQPSSPRGPDFREVVGHDRVKRALAWSAAGGHNVLLVGPPGSGKTLLARCLAGILPPLEPAEQVEVTKIHSAAGLTRGEGLRVDRPFRAPHHTVSWAGLVGGGAVPAPGEITLAHHGVLFLDELPEFPRRSLEALREPLEEGFISIARAQATLTFPARMLLIAAMNPCPCGNAGESKLQCHCSADRIRRYGERISGPLLDRIDMRLWAPAPASAEVFAGKCSSVDSAQLREVVMRTRAFRESQNRGAAKSWSWTRRDQWARLEGSGERLLRETAEQRNLSTRALTRLLRLARTIADGEEQPRIGEQHLLAAFDVQGPRQIRGLLDG